MQSAKVHPKKAASYISDDDLWSLATEVAPNWEKAAVKLGFNERGIELVRARCPNSLELQSYFALAYWRRSAITKNQIVAAQELLVATKVANGGADSETMQKVNNKMNVDFV